MRRRAARATYAYLALAGTFVVFAFVISSQRTHSAPPPPAPDPGPALTTVSGQPSPRGLDALWSASGHRAGCAQWSGADGMQPLRLTADKTAWFFSDTYLGPVRRESGGMLAPQTMINNSVVVETRHGDHATLATVTGGDTCRQNERPPKYARPVVGPGKHPLPHQWSWSAGGAVVGGTVVKFYNQYRSGGPRYLPVGTEIARFDLSHLTADPTPATAGPHITELPRYTPDLGGSPIMWGAAVLPDGGTTYVYGWQVADVHIQDKRLYVARVPTTRLADFSAWQFYDAPGIWSTDQRGARPVQPPTEPLSVSTGFSVVKMGGRYWLIQHEPAMFDARIDAYPAATPWGPFDTAHGIQLFSAPEVGADAAHDDVIIYEARVDTAESSKKRLVIGYSVNTVAVSTGCVSLIRRTDAIYRPRFITVPKSVFTDATPPSRAPAVSYAPRTLPSIMQRNPSQWHNTWDSPTRCPPVPKIIFIGAQLHGDGSITLNWPSAGLDITYQVYVRRRHAHGWGPYHAAGGATLTEKTLTGYTHHATYEWQVVPVNSKGTMGKSITITRKMP